MAQPLPLYCKTSGAYAAARVAGADDADVSARQKWESSFEREQEDKDRAHQLALGGLLSYNDMVSCSGPLGDNERATDLRPLRADPVRVLRPAVVGRAAGPRAGVLAVTARRSPEPFNVCGPLPNGMTLLEASAGTGKTFTIAALTTRYVAEKGHPIDRLLVITFTRMATGELRERVREHLVHAFDGLVGVLAGAEPAPDDEVLALLADAPRAVQEERRDRLAKAVADFDAATIETTHGFCCRSSTGSARPATSTATSPWSRTCVTSWRRWWTTSTSASSPIARTSTASPTTTPSRSPARSSTTPTRRSSPRRARATTWTRCGPASPPPSPRRWNAASGRARS